ncbi:MAG: chorismate synthase [Planctomycetes bacterium]|nr:chorismate synthase [Planctomycetota bacterium]
MLGCSYGNIFQVSVAGGSYQEGLTVHIQGVEPGLLFDESSIYTDLLVRKPGQGELTSPRREPDIPVIYSGVNAANTMPGFKNAEHTNGTPLVILIPNLDRHFEHIEQYQVTNRTPRPGHASYASYQKYGSWDDAIGAGIFSGRYTSTIVAAGAVAKKVLEKFGIRVFGYVKEAAGVKLQKNIPYAEIERKTHAYRNMRRDHDPIYRYVYGEDRIRPGMRFLEKMAVLSEVEKIIPDIQRAKMDIEAIRAQGLHPQLNCPDLETADAMYEEILRITNEEGDSSGGIVEIVAQGLPAGVGEPVFRKLDGEIGRMMSIGTIKGVEIGSGFEAARMTGSKNNDQLHMEKGKVAFSGNNAGGITGGLSTGQDIVVRLAVKPTPTIAKPQQTIDKVDLKDAAMAAVTRRDPTIVSRVWPVGEAFLAIILADMMMNYVAAKGKLQ